MGATNPYLSDEPDCTMVESGNCRCMCHGEYQDQQEQPPGCCNPQVFTSVLLGILSCVLMTGGVFLAFHRWDPMWLMVSGVGVVLIIIGTILHCCNNLSQRPRRHVSAKGCCSRPSPPDHVGHLVPNNGSLTEQLLPLSNARSVSQLSLNMLPGYFPPVVTAYGIEQHSAVVQNINRLVQHQQSQSSASSNSPGVNGSTAGKSFIVLSLPNDTTATNVQNLVATVYQLDGNSSEVTARDTCSVATTPVVVGKPSDVPPMVLKNAEVQTCNMWPPVTTVSMTEASSSRSACTQEGSSVPAVQSSSSNSETTQTESIPVAETSNLMDCSSDAVDVLETTSDALESSEPDSTTVNVVESPESTPVERTENETSEPTLNCVVSDVRESPSRSTSSSVTDNIILVSAPNPELETRTDCSEMLVDISITTDANANVSDSAPLLDSLSNNTIQAEIINSHMPVGSCSQSAEQIDNLTLESLSTELSDDSNIDTEIDDSEILERSSPPPSYDDVALEGDNEIGAFGLAYGTI